MSKGRSHAGGRVAEFLRWQAPCRSVDVARNEENGAVRVKIVLTKKQLRQEKKHKLDTTDAMSKGRSHAGGRVAEFLRWQAPCRSVDVARNEENGAVRLKIVLTKKQLRQMVAGMGQGLTERTSSAASQRPLAAPRLEQLLHTLRSRRMKRAEMGQCGGHWRPSLQSIPEELN